MNEKFTMLIYAKSIGGAEKNEKQRLKTLPHVEHSNNVMKQRMRIQTTTKTNTHTHRMNRKKIAKCNKVVPTTKREREGKNGQNV